LFIYLIFQIYSSFNWASEGTIVYLPNFAALVIMKIKIHIIILIENYKNIIKI
jgi:hypothetical protein